MALGWFRQTNKAPATPRRVLGWAVALTAIFGVIQLFMPLEDLWRGGRNRLMLRPADGQVVAVAIDDKTIAEFGTVNYSEARDAELIERLMALGARRVFFDRVFRSETDPAGVAQLQGTLRRYPGRVFFGEMTIRDPMSHKRTLAVPDPRYRPFVGVTSLNVVATPFGLSGVLPYVDGLDRHQIPSMSGQIAGVRGGQAKYYRPDWSINVRTVPTASMIDLVKGQGDRRMFAGRDVVVGGASVQINDILHIAGQDWLPGLYFHIVGAQTLREGHPVDRGWLPAWLVMLVLSAALVRIRRAGPVLAINLAAVGFLAVVPFITDRMFITLDYLPAAALFGIVSYRLRNLRAVRHAETTNAGTDLPNVIALGAEPAARRAPILALRIRNFAAICTSFDEDVGSELISAVVHRLTLPGEKATFYQSEATLFWLAPSIGRDELAAHVEGLARLLQSHFAIRGKHIDLQVAFGIEAQLSRPLAARISGASFAADQARRHNRTFEFFSDSDDKAVESQVTLISEMEAAISAGHIWVAYQPQYTLADQSLAGFEALVRWNHPAKGPIDTDLFVQAAESMNRIEALTLYILQRVCIECRSMFEVNPAITVSVNVSTRLLENSQFATSAVELVDRMGIERRRITFEITETAGMADHATTRAMMDELTGYGFKLAIDDYGMGNATLNYLRTVPCNEIKIDRSFITTLTADKSNQLLVKSTIALAHKMGRHVVAEGVEDLRTMQLLRKFGCDVAQGYYLGKPMPIRDVLPLSVMPVAKRIESNR